MAFLRIYQVALAAAFVLSGCSGSTPASDSTSGTVFSDSSQTNVDTVAATSSEEQPATSASAFDDEITPTSIQLLKIGAHKVECEGFHLTQCLLHTPAGQTDAEYFYDWIEGFEYEWGYEYELLVSVSTRKLALADSSQQHYELVEIIAQSEYQQQQSFEYVARYAHESIAKVSEGEYLLGWNRPMVCEPAACSSIDSALEQGQSVLLNVQYAENPGDPLQLASVVCMESPVAFDSACMSTNQNSD